jgi:hypothetical protein
MIFIIFLEIFTFNKYIKRYFNVSCVKKDVKYNVKSEGSFFKLIFYEKNNLFWECLLFNSKVCILIKQNSIKKIFWINFLFKSFLLENLRVQLPGKFTYRKKPTILFRLIMCYSLCTAANKSTSLFR